MQYSKTSTYENINWQELWLNGRKRKSWDSKGATDWDKKAASFAERNTNSPYASLLISRLPLEPSSSVLDIGSGPGTLALPLARLVREITAVDYSQRMLDILESAAKREGHGNIRCVHCSWEDDWQQRGIAPADIVIASRSLNVPDLSGAIDKLNNYSREYVFITDRIAPSPFDPEVFAAIGREFDSGPDYIFTLNMLYRKNTHPNMEVIQLDRDVTFQDMEEALASYKWMIKDITSGEEKRLERFLQSKIVSKRGNRLTLRRNYPPRWALIWWKKSDQVQL